MIIRCLLTFVLAATTTFSYAGMVTDNAASERAIRASLAGWVSATNSGDIKAAFEVWAPDLEGWAPDGTDDNYRIESEAATAAPLPPTTTYALTINEIIVEGSLAVVRDTWIATTKQQSEPDKVDTFRSFEVWRRQPDNRWKISRWIDGPMKSR